MDFLSVFLTILKYLGFVLGGIVALVIIIVLFLRFGRLHYKAFSTYKDDKLVIRIRVSIFYPLLFVYLDYIDDELVYDARILFLSYFYKNFITREKREKVEKEKNYRLSEDKRSIIDDILDAVMKEEEPETVKEKAVAVAKEVLLEEEARKSRENLKAKVGPTRLRGTFEHDGERVTNESPKEEETSPPPKENAFKKILYFLMRLPDIFKNLMEKFNFLLQYAKDIIMLFKDKENKAAVLFVWNAIKVIIYYIFTHRNILKLKYGDAEIDKTMETYGVIVALSATFGLKTAIELYPGEDVFDLNIRFNDYAKIFPILMWVLDLYKNDKLVDLITKIS